MCLPARSRPPYLSQCLGWPFALRESCLSAPFVDVDACRNAPPIPTTLPGSRRRCGRRGRRRRGSGTAPPGGGGEGAQAALVLVQQHPAQRRVRRCEDPRLVSTYLSCRWAPFVDAGSDLISSGPSLPSRISARRGRLLAGSPILRTSFAPPARCPPLPQRLNAPPQALHGPWTGRSSLSDSGPRGAALHHGQTRPRAWLRRRRAGRTTHDDGLAAAWVGSLRVSADQPAWSGMVRALTARRLAPSPRRS